METTYLYIITYGAVLVFLVAVAVRARRILGYPLNVRWELYPVPHEGERALHGGSRLEQSEWWTKTHQPDKAMELKFMLQEMVLIKALKEHNPGLWRFSFPFHFGLYLMAAFAAALIAVAVLSLAGVNVGATVLVAVGGFGAAAAALSMIGCLGLLSMRLTDPEMKPYTNFSHIFNLVFIGGTLGLVIAVLATSGLSAAPYVAYLYGMLTYGPLNLEDQLLLMLSVLSLSLLLAYIPLTHMSHFFVKWFTWHQIRWDDEPNVRGGRIEKMIEKALQYPVTWSGSHIKGDGKRTWADVATEELESK